MSVFSHFKQISYEYLVISRGTVAGDKVESVRQLRGIFKQREGMMQDRNSELHESSATLHVHPEDFDENEGIVGNGVRVDGNDYKIIGVVAGTDFSTGRLDFLKFTLERANYASPES